MLSATNPFSIVIFGGSGHLAKLKLYPSLYILFLKKRLPENFAIVGYARSEMTDEAFRELVAQSVRDHLEEVNADLLASFIEHVHYHQGQYDQADDFGKLATHLRDLESNWSDVVRLAYYSIPPTVFEAVSQNLCAGGVHDKKIPFRCIVEKPVGHDSASFEDVKNVLAQCFEDDEIYLLDHYLGKEAVRNVYYLRYANPIVERLFKNTLIDHVEIVADESKGLEGRAGYFEAAGTFRDFFQSHLLMMMALLTMRLQDDEDNVEPARLDALKQFYLPPATDLDDVILQGQYAAGDGKPGYLEEDGVAGKSRTNTYACMKLMTRISRWEGVPFYLRSGKNLTKKETRISVQFQEPRNVGEGASPNRLDIILQGEAGMKMYLQTKLGGTQPEFRPLIMEDPLVCFGDCLPEHSLLLLEAIHGNHQWYLTFEEVRTCWRLADPLQAHLDNPGTPLYPYRAGSKGPQEADEWIGKDGKKWF